MFKSISSYIL